jgi:hypothetical protein
MSLNIDKAFDTTWHSGLPYKFSELKYSTRIIELIVSFLTDRRFKVLVEGEISTSRKIAAGVPQGSVLAPILYNLYVNDAPAAHELILLCSRAIPVFTRQRNTNVVSSANCNAVSLQCTRGVSAGT